MPESFKLFFIFIMKKVFFISSDFKHLLPQVICNLHKTMPVFYIIYISICQKTTYKGNKGGNSDAYNHLMPDL